MWWTPGEPFNSCRHYKSYEKSTNWCSGNIPDDRRRCIKYSIYIQYFRCFVLYKLEGNSQCEFLFLKSLKSQRTLLTVSKCLNRKIQKLSMAFEQNPTQRVPWQKSILPMPPPGRNLLSRKLTYPPEKSSLVYPSSRNHGLGKWDPSNMIGSFSFTGDVPLL